MTLETLSKKIFKLQLELLHLSVQIQFLEHCSVDFLCMAILTFQTTPTEVVLPIKSVASLLQTTSNRHHQKLPASKFTSGKNYSFSSLTCIPWKQFSERDKILKTSWRSHLPERTLITRLFSFHSSCSVSYNHTFLAYTWGTTNS